MLPVQTVSDLIIREAKDINKDFSIMRAKIALFKTVAI